MHQMRRCLRMSVSGGHLLRIVSCREGQASRVTAEYSQELVNESLYLPRRDCLRRALDPSKIVQAEFAVDLDHLFYNLLASSGEATKFI